MKINLTSYVPSYTVSSVQQEDAEAYLERLVSEPCGSDGLTFSSKSNNSSAKSLAHAGKMIPSALCKSENERRKAKAFAERFPSDADLVGYDDEVDKRFKEFKDYTRTNEVAEVVRMLNEGRSVSTEVRNRVAKHVAQIGNYSGYLTDDIAEKFCTFAFNYWISKNPELRSKIELGVDA